MSASPSASVPAKKKGPANCGSFTEILSRVGSLGAKVHSCRADTFIINGSGESVDANAARDVTDLIAAIMRKLTMPAGCIDVTLRKLRRAGSPRRARREMIRRAGTKAARSPEPAFLHPLALRWSATRQRTEQKRIVERCAVIGSPQCSHLRSALAAARASERALTMAPR